MVQYEVAFTSLLSRFDVLFWSGLVAHVIYTEVRF